MKGKHDISSLLFLPRCNLQFYEIYNNLYTYITVITNYCLMFRDLETIETGSLIRSKR